MYNWSTGTTRLKKNTDQFNIFSLEQTINFGLNGTKISRKSLVKYWDVIKIDVDKKKYLSKKKAMALLTAILFFFKDKTISDWLELRRSTTSLVVISFVEPTITLIVSTSGMVTRRFSNLCAI